MIWASSSSYVFISSSLKQWQPELSKTCHWRLHNLTGIFSPSLPSPFLSSFCTACSSQNWPVITHTVSFPSACFNPSLLWNLQFLLHFQPWQQCRPFWETFPESSSKKMLGLWTESDPRSHPIFIFTCCLLVDSFKTSASIACLLTNSQTTALWGR